MKALCLYCHPEYGAPMVRSQPYYERFGIEMRVVKVRDKADVLHELRQSFDVLLLQFGDKEPHQLPEKLVDCGRPVILLERVDGAQLRASRHYLDCLTGVIKSYVFRDRQDYNRVYDRAHIALLHDCGIQCDGPLYRDELPQPQLSEESLGKIHVGYSGFGCHDIMRVLVDTKVDFDAPRPCDVHFAGTVNYKNPENRTTEVDVHRRLALQAAESWSGESVARAGRGIHREHYNAAILRSKTVLCPWGWGEATYRHYEAMLLGAVVIAPDTSHVECWPDIFQAGRYVPCRPDFADAHEKIAMVCDNWNDFREMRENNRRQFIKAWRPETVARKMTQMIKELAG